MDDAESKKPDMEEHVMCDFIYERTGKMTYSDIQQISRCLGLGLGVGTNCKVT